LAKKEKKNSDMSRTVSIAERRLPCINNSPPSHSSL
jgi:hypothetical protein